MSMNGALQITVELVLLYFTVLLEFSTILKKLMVSTDGTRRTDFKLCKTHLEKDPHIPTFYDFFHTVRRRHRSNPFCTQICFVLKRVKDFHKFHESSWFWKFIEAKKGSRLQTCDKRAVDN